MYRYSLRTLFAIITLLCVIPLPWIAYNRHKSFICKRTILVLQQKRVQLDYVDYETSSLRMVLFGCNACDKVTDVTFTSNKVTLEDIDSLKIFPKLSTLNLGDAATDSLVMHAQQLHALRVLNIGDSKVTDIGLKEIGCMSNLEELNLEGVQMSSDGIAQLNKLKRLRRLSLSDTHVADGDLRGIGELTSLEELDLTNTLITDSGLPSLYSLSNLNEIALPGDGVSSVGIVALRKAKPGLIIMVN